MNAISRPAAATMDREFAEKLLQTIDDPSKHGVHILFNQYWKYTPDDVRDKYLAGLVDEPAQRAFMEEKHYAEPYEFDALADLPEGSLGRALYDYMIDNGLRRDIADAYRAYHDGLETAGVLDRMPEDIKYSVLRTYQTHDFIHLVTGYPTNGLGEIAVQAFCLAQHKSPYFGMWVSVATARMTYLHPDKIEKTMDAITDGWALGRKAGNLMLVKWEQMLDRPVEDIRREFGISPGGQRALADA